MSQTTGVRASAIGRFAALAAFALVACALGVGAAAAESSRSDIPANLVTISASGQLEVPQDWLTMTLSTSRDGSEAVAVQTQLKQALDAALAVSKPAARLKQLEIRTGAFGVYPRHGSSGKIIGWQGTAELVLEGRDFLLISNTAAKVASMGVGQLSFSLSREARQKLESDAQSLAIERFKVRAAEVAKSFGFSGYALREVSVMSADQPDRPVYARAMAAAPKMSMASDTPVPVEAGTSLVTVTVSGSVQLR